VTDRLGLVVDARVLRYPLTGVGRYTLNMIRALASHPSAPSLRLLLNNRIAFDSVQFCGDVTPWVWPEAELEDHPMGDWRFHREAAAKCPKPGSAAWPDVSKAVWWGPAFQLPMGRFPLPRLATIHDGVAFRFPETMPWKFALYMRWMVKRSLANADQLVAVSHATKRWLVDDLRVGAHRVSVIGEGPMLDVFAQDAARAHKPPAGVEFPYDEPYWLAVGALEPRKNLWFLLDVQAELIARGDRRRLVIVGPQGWGADDVRRRLEREAGSLRVSRLPYLGDDKLAWLYARADALLMPSLDEGFGLPPIEAAAFGTPAFVSDRGALPEVALEPRFVLPLQTEKWVRALGSFHPRAEADAGLRKRLQAHADSFSWQGAANKLVRLGKTVSESAAPRSGCLISSTGSRP